ncbi:MAG TPA: nucleotidyltransferase family protein [Longimicrobium sp.]|nr:nucleotidyltransferase family protein [Longimicrobium sp.]
MPPLRLSIRPPTRSPSTEMIAGIVLAAGRSRRMGSPKAFLRLDEATFLERAVAALKGGGCEPVIVVAGPPDDGPGREIADAAARLGARVAVNPDPASQQADSLRAGLRMMGDDGEAAVVMPVDVPGVTAELVRAVIDAHRSTGAPVVQPYDGERHGHPALFARALWPELLHGELPEGARTVIHAHAAERAEVRVPRLHADVDTPEDYRRLLEGEA